MARPWATGADVAVSSDCIFTFEPQRAEEDAFGQRPAPVNAEFNTGVLLVRATAAGRAFVGRWAAAQRGSDDPKLHDQSHFNVVINKRRTAVDAFTAGRGVGQGEAQSLLPAPATSSTHMPDPRFLS